MVFWINHCILGSSCTAKTFVTAGVSVPSLGRSKTCACQKCQFTLIKEQPQAVVWNHVVAMLVLKSGILEMMVKILHYMTLHKPF